MRFDHRIVNFGDANANGHLTDDELMETCVLDGDNRTSGDVFAGRRQTDSGRSPP